ncbi:molybdenum cofactor biosynthesis protein B [Halomicrobium zhouii]|uniref:Molybdenum cofactor biosynthesis protein B n=1 Tax=Halomicrobium zhouii TaxID=767519 RepID=A0A1I6KAI1_9EURY|nr:MogA/MoaB family molybdenum cofactor biosynthesis protein [Halomicrobium zhouii]SFR88231.1 molybdenum cofactor biosynthesis protein B [Halomicrobium zhouii]
MSDHHDRGNHGDNGHDDHHDHNHHDHHHHGADETWSFAVLTISTSRSASDDRSGAVAREAIESAGHEVTVQEIVTDDEDEIAETIDSLLGDVDVVVTSGGTGLTPDDVTVEALRPLLEKELPGVGEYFRRLSHEQVGTMAMLSRATAGVADGTAVYAFPGNPDAVELGVEKVLLPEIDHVLGLARR